MADWNGQLTGGRSVSLVILWRVARTYNEMIYSKHTDLRHEDDRPQSPWGAFARYLEIADDRYVIRHVDIYEDGSALRYDRENWLDDLGMMADMKYDAAKWSEWWGTAVIVDSTEFEDVWHRAAKAANQPQAYKRDHGRWPILKRLDDA